MKIKRFLTLFIISIYLLSGISVFAVPPENQFFDYKLYTGTIWLLNDETNCVILQNVKTKNDFGVEKNVLELEYKEIPIVPQNIFFSDGEQLNFETVNAYMLDRKVMFIAARNAYYYKVLYMEIQ